MIDKNKLIEWLKADSVVVVSADVDAVPIGQGAGFTTFGQVLTITATNSKPEHTLEGANIMTVEEPTEEQLKAKADAAKKVQEGWEADAEE